MLVDVERGVLAVRGESLFVLLRVRDPHPFAYETVEIWQC